MPKTFLTTGNEEQGTTWTTASGAVTIPKSLYGTLIASVRKKLVWRPLAAFAIPPAQIPGSSTDIDLVKEGEQSLEVYDVAEGQEIPTSVVEYETFNLKPVKYAVRMPITQEMLEDGKWNLLTHNVEVAGYKMAKKIDSLIISTIDDNAGNTVSGGATISVPNITRAMRHLEDADYVPTDIVCGTNIVDDIRNIDIFVEADKSGVTNPSQSLIGRIYGMNVWVSNNQTTTTAYVVDRGHAFCVAEKRPVTINQWDDLVRDGKQAIATMRFVTRYVRASATAKITTS